MSMAEQNGQRPFYKRTFFWPAMAGVLLLLLIVALTAVLLALAEQSQTNRALLAELLTVQASSVAQSTPPPTQPIVASATAPPTDDLPTQTAVPSATAVPPTKPIGSSDGRDEGTAPRLVDDFYVTDEDTPLTVGNLNSLLRNDDFADAVTVGSGGPSGVANGTLSLNADGTFTYQPRTNFFGEDAFIYEACNGTGACALAMAVIAIRPSNDPPIADDDTVTVSEDDDQVTLTATLLNGDLDIEANPLTIAQVTTNAPSQVIFNRNTGAVAFAPGAAFDYLAVGETAVRTFQYQLTDGLALSNSATVTVTITGANDLPQAVADGLAPADPIFVDEDEISADLTSLLLENDTDPDDSDLPKLAIHTIANNSGGGTAVLASSGLTYNPNGQYAALNEGDTATDTFTYTIADEHDVSQAAQVTVTIRGVNQPPELAVSNPTSPVVYSATLGTAVNIATTATITDPDNAALSRFTIRFGDGDRLDGQAEYVQLTFQGQVITSTGSTITLTASGLALLDWQTAVQTAHYVHLSPTPTPGCRQFTFQATDANNGASNLQAVNVAVGSATCPAARHISPKAALFSRRMPQ
ncbi:MAG: tandem-95 repeat protein [Ardenticatenaceae bacterium]|nr:tandem-95 repeat protein [Anaerolineales bacterium]MCB8939668.1 tandem-95 repeat protein [Ardenticatenaceae bacterium]MCB8974907.1 tandem-95 repeat protein [Ardenticatenaceae bacterium]